jgi:hypothetical protein
MYKSIRFLLLVALGAVVLSGCGRYKHLPDNPVATPDATVNCPETGGVLGLRLNHRHFAFEGAYFSAHPGPDSAGVSKADINRALMDTGCFSAIRHRDTLSMRGHHIDYTLHLHDSPVNWFTLPFAIFSGMLVPVIMTDEYKVRLEYYYHGEKIADREGNERARVLFGLVGALYPVWMSRDDYSRTESERLANVFVSVIAEEEPAQ